MSNYDEIMRDINDLKEQLSGIAKELTHLRRALIGSYDTPGGLLTRVSTNERRINQLRQEFINYKKTRAALVEEYDQRVSALEERDRALKNRAIGIGIGLSLGSAGVGAAVAGLITRFFGG